MKDLRGSLSSEMKQAALIALTLMALASPLAADSCEQTSYGACFTVRGRYETYADAETIWIIGTHRKLMVDDGWEIVSGAYGDDPEGYDHYVIGNFTVCPLEKAVPGEMRRVCVQRAANLRRTLRKQSN
jgi:hypothetical protein